MTTAFVLSGGTSFGAVQVGMAQALAAHGVTPDVVVGTSVGAMNGAWLAARRPLEGLAEKWCALHRRDVFPVTPWTGLLGFLGRRDHLVSNRHLRTLIEGNVVHPRLEDFPVPFAAVAAELATGRPVLLESGPSVEAILASCALPGVFPAVEFEGRLLVDGGVVDNTPISAAEALGADEIWILAAGWDCELAAPPRTPVAVAVQSLSLLVRQRLALELAATGPRPDRELHVVPSPCPIDVSPLDFSHSRELIDRARRRAGEWLERGCPPGDREGPPRRLVRSGREPGGRATTS